MFIKGPKYFIFVFIVILFLPSSTIAIDLPDPPLVPPNISSDDKEILTLDYQKLVRWKSDLERLIGNFNIRCKNISEDKIEMCSNEKRRLLNEVINYSKAIESYKLAASHSKKPTFYPVITKKIKGKVYKQSKSGEWVRFYGDSPLREGERVRTGPHGFLKLISAAEAEEILFGPKTELKATKLNKELTEFELFKGKMYFYFKRFLRRESIFRIRFPNGHGGIRGTEFAINVENSGTTVVVIDGFFEIISESSGRKIQVGRGEQAMITADGAIEGPFRIDLGSINRWWKEKMP